MGEEGSDRDKAEVLDTQGKYTLTITFDPLTSDINVTGLNIPPWVSLGMLRYMEILVRRRELENAVTAATQNLPVIQIPGRRN